MKKRISDQEALIYAMVTVSAVNRTMTDAELMKIGDIVRTLPVFSGFDPELLVPTAETCGEILASEEGLQKILDIIHDTLSPRLYDTAYALAVEVAAADLHVEQVELRFLQYLRDRLDLDKLTVAAIERSARARYRTA